jgi:type 1 glutamine amidotransferase
MEFKSGNKFHDEFYQLSDFHSNQIHVVLSLNTSGLDQTNKKIHPGDSYALAYAKMYGKGRVFYSSLGHAPATWDDPRVRAMYFGAIEWALGLANADLTPNSNIEKTNSPSALQGVNSAPRKHE